MSKEYTKKAKLSNVIEKETYCELLQKLISEIEIQLGNDKTVDATEHLTVTQTARLEIELFELKKKLKLNQEIAADFRNDYEVVFLPTYERRIEDCFKNFDETYKWMLDNKDKIPPDNAFHLIIEAYPSENPNNEDEEKMLMFYEKIRGLMNIYLKEQKLNSQQHNKSNKHLRKA